MPTKRNDSHNNNADTGERKVKAPPAEAGGSSNDGVSLRPEGPGKTTHPPTGVKGLSGAGVNPPGRKADEFEKRKIQSFPSGKQVFKQKGPGFAAPKFFQPKFGNIARRPGMRGK